MVFDIDTIYIQEIPTGRFLGGNHGTQRTAEVSYQISYKTPFLGRQKVETFSTMGALLKWLHGTSYNHIERKGNFDDTRWSKLEQMIQREKER